MPSLGLTKFLRSCRLVYTDGNGDRHPVDYIEPADIPNFHWLRDKQDRLVKVHEQNIEIVINQESTQK